jgi:hypothetical protein
MAKTYTPEDLATRAFVVSMAGIGAFIAAVFLFIL